MSIEPGQSLLHYRLVEKIGEGGMGVVWRATDTTLDRDVAIKILPDVFAADPDRLGRFEREAKLLASLNHPNIAAVYGLHEADTSTGSVRFIAMELVEGQDLAATLSRGPLPGQQALEICAQVAEALEAAHGRGVIHRDLKPANVLVAPEGQVKVLDFGLAKEIAGDASTQRSLEHSPTVTSLGTVAGVVLGTAAYMSPEQARGHPVDARCDVWAFGALLYELLTGRRAFGGDTVSDTLAAILAREPDWNALPETTPRAIQALVRRFLDKDVKRRLRDIGFARVEITDVLRCDSVVDDPASAATAAPVKQSSMMRWILIGVVALLGLVVGWFARPTSPSAPSTTIRSSLELPDGLRGFQSMQLSADGHHLVVAASFEGTNRIYVRRMNGDEFRALPATDGATNVFLSPDGAWVGFFADAKLKKVPLAGGSPVVICDAADARGAAWGPDDTIYFTPFYTSGLWSVPAAGGRPVELTTPDQSQRELSHRWPSVLPGGRAVLFTIELPGSFDNARIAVLDLDTGKHSVLLDDASFPRYAASGHVIYSHEATLYSVPFDTERLEISGSPVPLVDHVVDEPSDGSAGFSFSNDGLLAYAPSTAMENRSLVRIGRDGSRRAAIEQRGAFGNVSVAPDGKRLALTIRSDVWTYDMERGALTRLTFDPGVDWLGVWTPDGRRVVFSSARDGAFNLYWRRADGAGEAERLTTSDQDHIPYSWSPDGHTLAFSETHPQTGADLWVLEMEDPPRAKPFLTTEYKESAPALSPDARWMAYASDESGDEEIHVRPYPGPGGRWQISTGGGQFPTWSKDGRELFYLSAAGLMSVPIETEPDFRAGAPRLVTNTVDASDVMSMFGFTLTADGESFLFIDEQEQGAPIRLVTNWFAELGRTAK